jgi:hypothetical protein
MAIKLKADEAWTVYCALDDALDDRRNSTGSKHNYRVTNYRLTKAEHKKLQDRYLRAFLVLERIEGGTDGEMGKRGG